MVGLLKKKDPTLAPMHNAFERCYRAVPTASLDDLRPSVGTVALKCFTTRCPTCRSYDMDGRIAFEETLRADHVLPWNCDDQRRRAIARTAGVADLPAYVVLTRTTTRVVRPPLS